MATISGSGSYTDTRAFVYTWSAVANGDVGNWVDVSACADLTVQIAGTFGSGGSVTLEGSNDGTNAVTLDDFADNALTKTSPALVRSQQLPRFVRPNVTAGDGTTSLNVMLLGRQRI